jgi:hypothetical protein
MPNDGAAATEPLRPNVLAGLRLDELLHGVQERLAEIVQIRDRMQGLLDAVLAVASGLELDATLRRRRLAGRPHGAAGRACKRHGPRCCAVCPDRSGPSR